MSFKAAFHQAVERVQEWWRQYRCGHYQTAIHTYLENVNGPLVRRQRVCLTCGKRGGYLPSLDHQVLVEMLDEAGQLPPGVVKKFP